MLDFNHQRYGLRKLTRSLVISSLLILFSPTLVFSQVPLQTDIGIEASTSESRYLLGPGDRIRLDMFDAPEYSGDYQVLSDGYVSLPLVGTIWVSGLTIDQAADHISQEMGQILRRPLVTVSLLQARPVNLAVTGEVHRPGTYTFTPDQGVSAPTVTKAIQQAGGITQSADIRQIQIRRTLSRNTDSAQLVTVDLWQLLREGDIQQDMPLRDGDTIIVPLAETLSLDETTELAAASFSPDQITVNVVGEVDRPGSIAIPPNTPLNQAILAAGGFNNRARRRSVELIRLNPNGTVTRQELEIDFDQGVMEGTNPPLRPYDTVVVRRSGWAGVRDVLGGVLSSVAGVAGLFRILGL